jgi:hypothetical protein
MRNKLAEDVLDANMLNLMQSYRDCVCPDSNELDGIIQFLEQTSFLVNFSNDQRPVTQATDDRLSKLLGVLQWFEAWETSITCLKNAKYTKRKLMTQETRADLASVVKGFIHLAKTITARGETVVPGRINSDIVENFFCQQRGVCCGQNTNPTYAQYQSNVNSIIIGQTSISKKSNAAMVKAGAEPVALFSAKRQKLSAVQKLRV